MICPVCGCDNPDSNLFCTNCGTKLADAVPIPTDNMNIPAGNENIPVDNTVFPMGNEGMPVNNDGLFMNNSGMPVNNNGMPMNNDGMFMNSDNMSMNSAPLPYGNTPDGSMPGGNMTGGQMPPNPGMPNPGIPDPAMPYPGMQMRPQSGTRNTGLIAAIAVVAGIVVLVGAYFGYNSLPSTKYSKGEQAFEQENYEEAIEYYEAAGDYEDAPKKAQEAAQRLHYKKGLEALDAKDYDTALSEFDQAGGYSDSAELMKKCHYEKGVNYRNSGDYTKAKGEFVLAENYSDAPQQIIAMGEQLVKDGKYEDAVSMFQGVSQAKDNKYYAYANGRLCLDKNEYDKAAEYFLSAGDTFDAKDLYGKCEYEIGKQYLALKEYDSAKEYFKLAGGYSDSGDLINACDLMKAKAVMDTGRLGTALTQLKALPEGTSYNDVSAADLIALLEKNQKWVDLCGVWTSTGGQMRTTEITSRYESWWYYDFAEGDATVDVTCVLKDDGTVDVNISGFIMTFTNYASEKTDIKRGIASITTRQNMKDLGTLTIDGTTSVTLKKGKITASYKKSEKLNGKSYTYKTNVTYGKRKIEY